MTTSVMLPLLKLFAMEIRFSITKPLICSGVYSIFSFLQVTSIMGRPFSLAFTVKGQCLISSCTPGSLYRWPIRRFAS